MVLFTGKTGPNKHGAWDGNNSANYTYDQGEPFYELQQHTLNRSIVILFPKMIYNGAKL